MAAGSDSSAFGDIEEQIHPLPPPYDPPASSDCRCCASGSRRRVSQSRVVPDEQDDRDTYSKTDNFTITCQALGPGLADLGHP